MQNYTTIFNNTEDQLKLMDFKGRENSMKNIIISGGNIFKSWSW